MGQTTILDETIDTFDSDTGEITRSTKRRVKKSYTEPTDEFIKVSKYLNTIFAYNNIPLNLVGISLLLAQRMEFKTNIVYLLKSDKKEMAEMLGISEERVKTLLSDCKKYDILRPTDCRGKFAVNAYLFSTGSAVETRNLQAHFDFDNNVYGVCADHKNLITGETVRKSVTNKRNSQIEGQMSFADYLLEKNHE
jgi:hypothetical protein